MKDLDIKKAWNQEAEDQSVEFNAEMVEKIIDRGSVNIIQKFVKALKLEMWINLVVLTGIAFYMTFDLKWEVAMFLFVVDVGYFIYYRRLIKKLSEKTIDNSVLEYLHTVYRMINRFIAHYKVANVILALPLFMTGMYFANPDIFSEKYFSQGWFIVLLFGGFALAILLLYWFLYFLYGKKAEKIGQLITELTDDESI
ncbi:hypothetical protein [Reichenbachiella sp. MALMAid0571]|uniref:hypothetical protein n=1 Tax=Reichenbachiella sp. MALMAid0571 TaxID=3143939 RepID=UPI0032DFF0DA